MKYSVTYGIQNNKSLHSPKIEEDKHDQFERLRTARNERGAGIKDQTANEPTLQ